MLNKVLAAIPSVLVSLNVFAMLLECPPISAFHHPEIGKDWILDKKYIDQGWSKGSDFEPVKQSPLKELVSSSIDYIDYTVQLRKDEYWKATCYYTVPGDLPSNENAISVSTNQDFDEKKVSQPPFIYFQYDVSKWAYSCSTTSDVTSRHCIWEASPVPPIPLKAK